MIPDARTPPTAPTAAAGHLSADDIAVALDRPRPTPEQRAVIEAPLEPLLVVAGAGSGKTETMSARVVWLVANALVAPDAVLGLTFTRKAAAELATRVRRRLAGLRAAGLHLPAGLPPSQGRGGHVEDDAGEPSVATYHSYAGGVVADHGLRLGIDPAATLIGEAAAHQVAAEVVEGWDDLPGLDAAPPTVTAAVLRLAGECAEHLVSPEEVAAHLRAVLDDLHAIPGKEYAEVRAVRDSLADRLLLMPLVTRYGERKAERGVLDFGDQVALAARLAREVPAVRALERARYGVVLLDEYQDTSHAQLELLRALFGDGHPVTAVGDPHQSIYGWRGASAGGLESFPGHFPLPQPPTAAGVPPPRRAPVLALSTSWRNDVAVLDAANLIAEPLRVASRLGVPRLVSRPGAGPGVVRAAFAGTAEEEAEHLTDVVAACWHADTALPPPQRRTTAVLCRKRSQFPAVEAALRARGLPVEVIGLGGLLSRPEVVDVVAALRVVHDPARGDALLRLLTGARWRLGVRDLAALAAWSRASAAVSPMATIPPAGRSDRAPGPVDPAEAGSLVAALDALPPRDWATDEGLALSPTGRDRLEEASAVLRRLRRSAGLALPELVVEAERALGLDVELAARPGVAPGDARVHVQALEQVAADFATGAERASLGGLLAWLDAADTHERGLSPGEGAGAESVEPSASAVQLLTVHAAKGLEWDVVAVPGLVEGTFPAGGETSSGWLKHLGALPYDLRGDRDALPQLAWAGAVDGKDAEARRAAFVVACGAHELDEERRLAYVAATRARSLLLLSGAWWGTGVRPRTPSRFLRESLEGGTADGDPLPGGPPEEANPLLAQARTASWPLDPVAHLRSSMVAAAELVERARTAARAASAEPPSITADHSGSTAAPPAVTTAPVGGGGPGRSGEGPGWSGERSGWSGEVDQLLAERDGARGAAAGTVALPAHLSASALVDLAADPAAVALAVRRPVPVPPRPATRRGTLFHAWLEQRFRAETLVDLDDVPGAQDADPDADERLEELQAAFLASEWAQRTPLAVEVDLETPVAGLVVRCRIDAVFPAAGVEPRAGGVDVVDWKSGRPPTGERARSGAVQLAVYRLAWSRLHTVPLERVGAAFFYASTGQTRRPVDLLDEAGLEALVLGLPLAP